MIVDRLLRRTTTPPPPAGPEEDEAVAADWLGRVIAAVGETECVARRLAPEPAGAGAPTGVRMVTARPRQPAAVA